MPSYRRRLLKHRTRDLNVSGVGQTWYQRTKTYTFRTLGRLVLDANDGTTASTVNVHTFMPHNVNDPMGSTTSSFVDFHTFGGSGAAGLTTRHTRHPQYHKEAIEDNYTRARVLAANISLEVTITEATDTSADYIVAWFWCPSDEADPHMPELRIATSTFDLPVDAENLWFAVRQNAGWSWRRFSSVQSGGSPFPVTGVIDIAIPDLYKLGKALNRGKELGATPTADPRVERYHYEHEIADFSFETRGPAAGVFLKLFVFKLNGAVLADGDAFIDVTIDQRCKLWRVPVSEDISVAGGLFVVPDNHP